MMAANDLPTEFDIIVLGTGLTETIAAAAFSRIGLKVLHLDRNDFYGGSFANFNLDGIEKWAKDNEDLERAPMRYCTFAATDEMKQELSDGDSLVGLPNARERACHFKSQFHVRKRTAEENAQHKKKDRFVRTIPTPPAATSTDENEVQKEHSQESVTSSTNVVDSSCDKTADYVIQDKSISQKMESQQAESGDYVQEDGSKGQESDSTDSGIQSAIEASSTVSTISSGTSFNGESSKTDMLKENDSDESNQADVSVSESESACVEPTQKEDEDAAIKTSEGNPEISEDAKEPEVKMWTEEDVRDEWRRYCFDISPRVLHCSGDLVDLLIQSDVARYCEFRTVSRVLTLLNDTLQQVPCSRADVFSSKLVSLIEKRLMMKFLQFASDYMKSPKEYEEYLGKPFTEFLQSKKLTANVRHFVQHAIAMVTDTATTEEGLQKTQKFLQSLGRYGNTAFLFPLYGSGELPQAFSRLSAVFGGIYCLMMSANFLVADAENKCCAVVTSENQRISCKYLVADSSYLPSSYVKDNAESETSRAIFITDKSICPSKEEELSLLNFPVQDDPDRPITVLEMPYSACVCPKGVFVVQMTRVNGTHHVNEDFDEIRNKLFNDGSDSSDAKPRVLWSMYFSQLDRSQVELTDAALKNVLVAPGGGDVSVDMDYYVREAKKIFQTVCPTEEFLPTPPDPEDIIHVDDTEATVASGPAEFSQDKNSDHTESQENPICDKVPETSETEREEETAKEVEGAEVQSEVKTEED